VKANGRGVTEPGDVSCMDWSRKKAPRRDGLLLMAETQTLGKVREGDEEARGAVRVVGRRLFIIMTRACGAPWVISCRFPT